LELARRFIGQPKDGAIPQGGSLTIVEALSIAEASPGPSPQAGIP